MLVVAAILPSLIPIATLNKPRFARIIYLFHRVIFNPP
jgi:hypothetical protein